MKNILRDFLTFNKRERNGVFILLSIIFVLVLYLNISSSFIPQQKVDFTAFEKDLKSFETPMAEEKSLSVLENAIVDKTEKFAVQRFPFDPNHLPDEDWKRLGLTDKQIKSIKKYESKGGKFRKKEDLKKMYCIKEEQYNSLEPFIQIAAPVVVVKSETVLLAEQIVATNTAAVSKPQGISLVELNTADSAQLTTIKGIGAFYAKSIIKYRNSIGGFISKEQLLEIWKFDAEKLAAIEKYITIDTSKIKKLNINTCEAAELKSAYINWAQANGIVNYRKNHGKYKTVDEIRNTDLVDEQTYRKIVPYLVVD